MLPPATTEALARDRQRQLLADAAARRIHRSVRRAPVRRHVGALLVRAGERLQATRGDYA